MRSNRGKDKNVIRIMNNIEEIRTRKEGQTFDCKSIQIEPKALAIPIVAMANADGGLLAIGISDKTRRIEGVDQHAEKLNELLRFLSISAFPLYLSLAHISRVWIAMGIRIESY